MDAEVEDQAHPAAVVDRLEARRRGHRQQQVDLGQHLVNRRVVDVEIGRERRTGEDVLGVVAHAVERVLVEAVPGLEEHLPIGVGAGVLDQLRVDVVALDLRCRNGRLVGEQDCADRAAADRVG